MPGVLSGATRAPSAAARTLSSMFVPTHFAAVTAFPPPNQIVILIKTNYHIVALPYRGMFSALLSPTDHLYHVPSVINNPIIPREPNWAHMQTRRLTGGDIMYICQNNMNKSCGILMSLSLDRNVRFRRLAGLYTWIARRIGPVDGLVSVDIGPDRGPAQAGGMQCAMAEFLHTALGAVNTINLTISHMTVALNNISVSETSNGWRGTSTEYEYIQARFAGVRPGADDCARMALLGSGLGTFSRSGSAFGVRMRPMAGDAILQTDQPP